jgi:hypothetical protein
MDLGLELLPVARRVNGVVDIVMAEDRELGHGVAHPVVGFAQSLQADEVVRGGEERLVAQVGDRPHLPEPDVRAVGDQARDDGLPVHHRLHVPAENMAESVQALASAVGELQEAGYVNLRQVIEEGVVDGVFLLTCVRQGPGGDDAAFLRQLDVGVLAFEHASVHRLVLGFQLCFEFGQQLPYRFGQRRCVDRLQDARPMLPPGPFGDEVPIEAAKTQRILDGDIARLQAIAQQAVDQELVLVRVDAALSSLVLLVEIGPSYLAE